MTIKFLDQLSAAELSAYKDSSFYRDIVLSTYQFSDCSLDYYSEYFGEGYKNYSIIVLDTNHEPVIALYAFAKPPVFSHFNSAISVCEGTFTDVSQKNKAYKSLLLFVNDFLNKKNFTEIIFNDNKFFTAEYYSKISSTAIEHNSVVDLVLPADQLKANLRKSYKSL